MLGRLSEQQLPLSPGTKELQPTVGTWGQLLWQEGGASMEGLHLVKQETHLLMCTSAHLAEASS